MGEEQTDVIIGSIVPSLITLWLKLSDVFFCLFSFLIFEIIDI